MNKDFSIQENLEIAGLLYGVKPVIRFERDAQSFTKTIKSLQKLNLKVMNARVFGVETTHTSIGDRYLTLERSDPNNERIKFLYASLPQSQYYMEKLAHIEFKDPSSHEIGFLLGYPECCVKHYNSRITSRDWIVELLSSTPENSAGFAECNKLARLFGEWVALPDYFPCSFACDASKELAKEYFHAAIKIGLDKYLKKSIIEMSVPILVSKHGIARINDTVTWVKNNIPNIEPRIFTWQSN